MGRTIARASLRLRKLRRDGIGWLLQRLCDEWELPRSGPGQVAYRSVRHIGRRLGFSRGITADETADPHALYAFYDLAVAPITFDFLWFLVGSELERQRLKLPAIRVIIVPGQHDGLRREDPDYDKEVTPAARRERIDNILIASCSLLPSVASVAVAPCRADAEGVAVAAADRSYPRCYEPALPRYADSSEPLRLARERAATIGVLRAPAAELAAVDHWLRAHGIAVPPVTITLRDYGYMQDRNSNYAAWTEFARKRDPVRHPVVFVPDAERCRTGLPALELAGLRIYPEAALNICLRMALYERAYLNLGVNNGPMGLCWLNASTRYLTFKILTETAPQATPAYMRQLGFEIGASLPGAAPWQKWVWENDDLSVIEREFAAAVESIERGFSRSVRHATARSATG
jgi:hypothetical protein